MKLALKSAFSHTENVDADRLQELGERVAKLETRVENQQQQLGQMLEDNAEVSAQIANIREQLARIDTTSTNNRWQIRVLWTGIGAGLSKLAGALWK